MLISKRKSKSRSESFPPQARAQTTVEKQIGWSIDTKRLECSMLIQKSPPSESAVDLCQNALERAIVEVERKARDTHQRFADEDAWTGFPSGDDRTKRKMIEDYIDKRVAKLPLRLIDLKNHKLIQKADLANEIKNFQMNFIGGDGDQWIKTLTEKIDSRLSYAIFSHRWSEHEPDLKDATENFSRWQSGLTALEDVPQNTGVRKLLKFCAKAQKHGLDLAWSDTCCIDQTNSVELQDAIGSMFQWYRGAKLCIVHMADTKTPEDAKAGKGEWHDAWFKRGWTLQELLAPKALKFYTEGWDELVEGSNNDKENEELLQKLEDATGIESEFIKNFVPGVKDWKEKMKWVSGRKTTRGEDIVYILFGMFGLDINGCCGHLVS